jgi:hypothetical protein
MAAAAVDSVLRAGDFAVISTGTRATRPIEIAEWFNGDHFGKWDHAVICVSTSPLMIVEARPGGAEECQWHYQGRPHFWSSGALNPTDGQRTSIVTAARGFIGVPYSYLDYFAIAAHRLYIPAPNLRGYIASTGHMICSQLVDAAWAQGGYNIFSDSRWPGYVTPMQLGNRIHAS